MDRWRSVYTIQHDQAWNGFSSPKVNSIGWAFWEIVSLFGFWCGAFFLPENVASRLQEKGGDGWHRPTRPSSEKANLHFL